MNYRGTILLGVRRSLTKIRGDMGRRLTCIRRQGMKSLGEMTTELGGTDMRIEHQDVPNDL